MVLHQLQLLKDIFQLAVQKVEQTFFSVFRSFFPSCKSYKETRHHQFHILCWWHIMNSSAFPALAEAFLFPTRNTVFENWKKVSFYSKKNIWIFALKITSLKWYHEWVRLKKRDLMRLFSNFQTLCKKVSFGWCSPHRLEYHVNCRNPSLYDDHCQWIMYYYVS